MDIVKAMVPRTDVDLEARDEYGRTPLLWAAQNGHLAEVQYPRHQGVDKEAKGVSDDNTLLHWATSSGRLTMVQ